MGQGGEGKAKGAGPRGDVKFSRRARPVSLRFPFTQPEEFTHARP
jgi:hypothetical protein